MRDEHSRLVHTVPHENGQNGVEGKGAYIVVCGLVLHGSLDTVSQETEDGSSPQEHGEATKHLNESRVLHEDVTQPEMFNLKTEERPERQRLSTHFHPIMVWTVNGFRSVRRWYLFTELDPLGGGGRRSESVGAIAGQILSRLGTRQTLSQRTSVQ